LNIVLLGPPGVGKGTQADILSERTGLPHVSSGELFRENMKNRTVLGQKIQSYMDKGELVPDDLTIAMVEDRLAKADCRTGVILDGFPRTTMQADELSRILKKNTADVDVVPFINASKDILVERASGRWTCKANGHIFHEKFDPPKIAGKCDFDGSDLLQREDDKPATVARRIQVYLEQTAPLIEYYRSRQKLVEIDGAQPIEKVADNLLAAVRT
jgi:adenylate kinase